MKTKLEGHIMCDGCHQEAPELNNQGFTVGNIYCDNCLDKKMMSIKEMKKILSHLDYQLTLTSSDSPWLIWSQMLYRVADEMRKRQEALIS